MYTLKDILKEYYDANQISKSMNILQIALIKDIASDKLKPTKCICDIFEPGEGWGEKVEKSSTEEDKCIYTRLRIRKLNNNFVSNMTRVYVPSPNCAECRHCYMFLAREFINRDSNLNLTIQKRKKRCRKS